MISVGRMARARSLANEGSISIAKSTFTVAPTASLVVMNGPPSTMVVSGARVVDAIFCQTPASPVSKLMVFD